jgi:hypothetical protein
MMKVYRVCLGKLGSLRYIKNFRGVNKIIEGSSFTTANINLGVRHTVAIWTCPYLVSYRVKTYELIGPTSGYIGNPVG